MLQVAQCKEVPKFYGLWHGKKKKYYSLVFEFVDGVTLREKLKTCTDMPLKEKTMIIYQITEVLSFLHDKKRHHRDIKPENIMIKKDDTVKLIDFGTAKLARMTMTYTSKAVGTTFYMAPDNFDYDSNNDSEKPIEISYHIDIWSLGVMITEILSGVFPYSHMTKNENHIESWLIQKKAFPVPHEIQKKYSEFLPIIHKCLEVNKQLRCDGNTVLEYLKPYLD